MKNEKLKIALSIAIPSTFIFLMWVIKSVEVIFDISFVEFGINPLTSKGLIGIIASPLIHGSFSHLFSNTIPLLLLSVGIIYFYSESYFKIFVIIYLFTNISVWFFGRPAFHIGASGLVYGFAAFLFFSGLFKKDPRSITLALLVVFLYGGLIWGLLPIDEKVSHEAHLFGSFWGLVAAFIFKDKNKYKKYDWEDEDVEYGGNLEVSYKNGYPHE